MTKLITDSGCDLSPELCSGYGIKVVELKVVIGGKTYKDRDLDLDVLYAMLETDEGKGATTSTPSIEDFRKAYEEVLSDDDSTLVLTIPSRLSGTYNAAKTAAETFKGIKVIDSRTATTGLGLATIKTSELLKYGCDIHSNEFDEYLNQHVLDRIRVYASVEDLRQLRKSGRINLAMFLAGSLLNIYPVISLKDGEAKPVARVRSYKRAMDEIIDFIKSDLEHFEPSIVHFMPMHGAMIERAEELSCRISDILDRSGIKANPFPVGRIGSVIGTHAGPKMYGAGLLFE